MKFSTALLVALPFSLASELVARDQSVLASTMSLVQTGNVQGKTTMSLVDSTNVQGSTSSGKVSSTQVTSKASSAVGSTTLATVTSNSSKNATSSHDGKHSKNAAANTGYNVAALAGLVAAGLAIL